MTKTVYEMLAGCISSKGADDYVFTRGMRSGPDRAAIG